MNNFLHTIKNPSGSSQLLLIYSFFGTFKGVINDGCDVVHLNNKTLGKIIPKKKTKV